MLEALCLFKNIVVLRKASVAGGCQARVFLGVTREMLCGNYGVVCDGFDQTNQFFIAVVQMVCIQ